MESTDHAVHVVPSDQPSSVHEVAERLFPAYTVDGGSVHLAGCTLEDRPFVRLDFRRDGKSFEVFVDAQGQEIDCRLVEALGMTEVAELEKPPLPFSSQIGQLTEAGQRLAASRFSADGPCELLGATVLWCKYAVGKLRFVVGDDSTDLPFSGWSRTLRPPPFVCPYTASSTFHLAATDDGRIVAAEQIARCAETGRRVLADDLVTCSVTGRRAMAELTATCPVSCQRVLRKEMVECGTCRQRVSPTSIRRDVCAACRELKPVSKADPRMARLLDEHPPLDRWRNWRISETAAVYVLSAAGWFKRLMVVADKESLELKFVATGSRIPAAWHPVEPSQYDYAIRG